MSLSTGRSPKACGIGFRSPTLLAEESLEQIHGPRHAPVRDWHLQMRDAGLEVVKETRVALG